MINPVKRHSNYKNFIYILLFDYIVTLLPNQSVEFKSGLVVGFGIYSVTVTIEKDDDGKMDE
jgi:hypothetical protein